MQAGRLGHRLAEPGSGGRLDTVSWLQTRCGKVGEEGLPATHAQQSPVLLDGNSLKAKRGKILCTTTLANPLDFFYSNVLL